MQDPLSISPYLPQSRRLQRDYITLSKSEELWNSDIHFAMEAIVKSCSNSLQASRVSIWNLTQAGTLECQILFDIRTKELSSKQRLTIEKFPAYFQAIEHQRVLDASHARKDPRTIEFTEAYLIPYEITSMLDASFRREGRIEGIICVEHTGLERIWSTEEQNYLVAIADLISQLRMFYTLKDSESRYKLLFDQSADAIFIIHNGNIVDCNNTALRLFHSEKSKLIGLPLTYFAPENQPCGTCSAHLFSAKIELALNGQPQLFEWLSQHRDGSHFYTELRLHKVELQHEPLLLVTVHDIDAYKTVEQKLLQSQQELEFRANHDSLTGLPNRSKLHIDALSIQQSNSQLTLMLLDLNRFKEVNDTLGHYTGDQLLKRLGIRLQRALKILNADLYRLGGDEFAILISGDLADIDIEQIAETVNYTVRQPTNINGVTLEVCASIGIARYPENGNNSHDLLRCADIAMYKAKVESSQFAYYDPDLDSNSPTRLKFMAELGTAIRTNQMRLYYQPKIDIATSACIGCEALIRWEHPVSGMVSPAEFIPIAEMSDHIHALSFWVLEQAIKQISLWLSSGLKIPIAVNLSARNLINQSLPNTISQLLKTYDVEACYLQIEITESAFISDPKSAEAVVSAISQLGISLSIDDFGTGYSSLSYLKRLPVQTLKVDRSFVLDMLNNDQDYAIVRSTIGLAHSFGLNVIAEGVENQATLDALQLLKCDQAQGYFVCRPVPAKQFTEWYHATQEIKAPTPLNFDI